MFNRFKTAGIAIAAVLLTVPCFAQTAPLWNRGIADVQLEHLSSGGWDVIVDWYGAASAGSPTPLDLSTQIEARVNGGSVPGGTALQALIKDGDLQPCGGGGIGGIGCSSTPCAYFSGNGTTTSGHCYLAGDIGCDCGVPGIHHIFPSGIALSVGDIITVTLTPSATGVGELYTSDDARSVTFTGSPFTSYCYGDGALATECPCGNHGLAGHGCSNSVNAQGAQLTASGSTAPDSFGNDSVVLHGSGMPATSTAVYLKGDANDPAGSVFGDGVLCVSGSLIRLRTKINAGGASQFPEPGDPSLSVRGATPPGSGLIGHYQVYYRNAASFCTAATFNLSNGMKVEW